MSLFRIFDWIDDTLITLRPSIRLSIEADDTRGFLKRVDKAEINMILTQYSAE